jgi:hypothetical protein
VYLDDSNAPEEKPTSNSSHEDTSTIVMGNILGCWKDGEVLDIEQKQGWEKDHLQNMCFYSSLQHKTDLPVNWLKDSSFVQMHTRHHSSLS